jgi:hypothetical protein
MLFYNQQHIKIRCSDSESISIKNIFLLKLKIKQRVEIFSVAGEQINIWYNNTKYVLYFFLMTDKISIWSIINR